MKRRISTAILIVYAILLIITVVLALIMLAAVNVIGPEFGVRPLSPLASFLLLLLAVLLAGWRVVVHRRARKVAEGSRGLAYGTAVPPTETPADEG